MKKKLENRFWGKVNKSDGCWMWNGHKNNRGYGVFGMSGKNYLAHRVSYTISLGTIQDGMCVLHRCDTPACVNPSHLFLGTQKDNMMDRLIKKRHKPNRSSKYYGIHRRTDNGKWRACLIINGKYKTIGCYASEIKAAAVYNFEVAMLGLKLPINKITL